jgi:hypothetical protein
VSQCKHASASGVPLPALTAPSRLHRDCATVTAPARACQAQPVSTVRSKALSTSALHCSLFSEHTLQLCLRYVTVLLQPACMITHTAVGLVHHLKDYCVQETGKFTNLNMSTNATSAAMSAHTRMRAYIMQLSCRG